MMVFISGRLWRQALPLLLVLAAGTAPACQTTSGRNSDAALRSAKAIKKTPPLSPTSGPIFSPEATVIDYGTVAFGSTPERQLKFTNWGDAPLLIQNARSSCGCVVSDWPKTPFQPGESGVITVRYDTRREGPINKTLDILTNQSTEYQAIALKGTVLAAGVIAPGSQSHANAPAENLADLPEGLYQIRLAASKKVLDAFKETQNENGGGVHLWRSLWCLGLNNRNQKWHLKREGELYRFVLDGSGKSLDAWGPDIAQNGCKIQVWDGCPGGCPGQLWKIREVSEGKYQIILASTGKALDAHGPDIKKDGCRVQLYDACPDGCPNQIWELTLNSRIGCM